MPSAPALGVGGAREFGDFGDVDGFGTVGLVAEDAGVADFGLPGVLLPYFTSGNWSMTQQARIKRNGVNTILYTLHGYLLHYCSCLLVCKHLGGGLEEYLHPSLNKQISPGMPLHNLRLKFLLCSKEAVP